MNPQPDPILGHLFASLFVVMLIIYTIKAIKDNKIVQYSDDYIIGYIRDNNADTITVSCNVVENIESSQLYTDCVAALVALGMKKSEAKTKTKNIFKTCIPKTIQDFLSIALKTQS